MAATIASVAGGEDVWGKHRVKIVTFTGDNSYPTGGYTLNSANTGLRSVVGIDQIAGNTASSGIIVSFNTTTGKVQFFYPTNTATSPNVASEVPNGTNVSTVTVTLILIGLDD